jgi:hypothetical protein
MANEGISALLLQNSAGGAGWVLEKGEWSRGIANKFLICCLLDWQWDTNVAWRKGEHLVEKLGGPENVWAQISRSSKQEWDSNYEEYGKPHRFRRGYGRLWGIANGICARYDADARKIWSGKSPFEALIHLWALEAGDQISRMIVGALRDCGQITGDTSDVKADLHLRRVLGRVLDGEEISAADAARVTELTRQLNPTDPWQLDWPLWKIGKQYCRPTNPDCSNCYLKPHCAYYRYRGGADVVLKT